MNLSAQDTCPLSNNTRLIALTQGQFSKISACDYERVAKLKWYAARSESVGAFYAVRSVRTKKENGEIEIRRMSLARFILHLGDDDPRWADHINGDTLDNTRGNLRAVTPTGNARNRGLQRNNKSGFKGVSKHNGSRAAWAAYIAVNGKNLYLGLHPTPELAYAAYCEASARLHGDFARAQ